MSLSPVTVRERDAQEAARAKGVQLHILKASAEAEIDAAFDSLVQLRAGAILVGADPFFTSRSEQLVELASRHSVPAIYEWREFVAAGGLIFFSAAALDITAAAITAAAVVTGSAGYSGLSLSSS